MKWEAEWTGCLLYAAVAGFLIACGPGLQYDEALTVHGAVHLLHGHGVPPFAHESGSWLPAGGKFLPLMVISYVGAFKDYVALPLLMLFGTSAATVRIAPVLMTLPLLWLGGRTMRLHCGPAAATVFGCALAIHPTFAGATTFDNGAVSLWMLPLALFVAALDAFASNPDRKTAILAGAAGGFAIWCRANCAWFIVAIAIAFAVMYRSEVRRYLQHAVAIGAGAMIGALPFLVFQIASHGAIFHFFLAVRTSPHLLERFGQLAGVLVFAKEHRVIWRGPEPLAWEVAFVVIASILSVGGALLSNSRFARPVALATLLTAAAMLTSSAPVAPHHLCGLLPFVAACAAAAAGTLRQRAARVAVAIAAAVYIFIAASELLSAGRNLRATGGIGPWSDAINAVAADENARMADVLDWGLYNNLYVLTNGQLDGREIFWNATEQHSGRGLAWRAEIAHGGAYLVPAWQIVPRARRGFFAAVRETGASYSIKRFAQRDGTPYADLYVVKPRGRPSP